MTKNFGIIGCGMIANFHAKAAQAAGGTLVACFDTRPEAADKLAEQFPGCKPYHDLKAFTADKNIDIGNARMVNISQKPPKAVK